MQKFLYSFLLVFGSTLCIAQEYDDLALLNKKLRPLEGKYVFDADIFEIPIVVIRLKKLLKEKVFNDVQECFMTVTPYKISHEIFHFSGSSKLTYNNCSIAINLKQNVFHVSS